jgi:hypothetical protein
MPIPKQNQNEDDKTFVARCMDNGTMKKDYPDNKQRVAVCLGQTSKQTKGILSQTLEILGLSLSYDCDQCGDVEEINVHDTYIPAQSEYIDCGEESEEVEISVSKYEYIDPVTQEVYYFNQMRDYRKNGNRLIYIGRASEYQGRKVKLNKPFRTPDGPKKFSVYVKNEKGNIVKVNFGDPNMEIKKDIPARRKSFRARMRCSTPGPKWKARYWACKSW